MLKMMMMMMLKMRMMMMVVGIRVMLMLMTVSVRMMMNVFLVQYRSNYIRSVDDGDGDHTTIAIVILITWKVIRLTKWIMIILTITILKDEQANDEEDC